MKKSLYLGVATICAAMLSFSTPVHAKGRSSSSKSRGKEKSRVVHKKHDHRHDKKEAHKSHLKNKIEAKKEHMQDKRENIADKKQSAAQQKIQAMWNNLSDGDKTRLREKMKNMTPDQKKEFFAKRMAERKAKASENAGTNSSQETATSENGF